MTTPVEGTKTIEYAEAEQLQRVPDNGAPIHSWGVAGRVAHNEVDMIVLSVPRHQLPGGVS